MNPLAVGILLAALGCETPPDCDDAGEPWVRPDVRLEWPAERSARDETQGEGPREAEE